MNGYEIGTLINASFYNGYYFFLSDRDSINFYLVGSGWLINPSSNIIEEGETILL